MWFGVWKKMKGKILKTSLVHSHVLWEHHTNIRRVWKSAIASAELVWGKWSFLDSFSNALGQHQIHLNLYWIALKSNRTFYVYSVYLTLIFHTAKLNTNIANYHFSGNWIITSVGAVHRKLGTLSSMRLQKGKESLYNTFSLNRKRKLKSKRK